MTARQEDTGDRTTGQDLGLVCLNWTGRPIRSSLAGQLGQDSQDMTEKKKKQQKQKN
jgi:hypothetical protein